MSSEGKAEVVDESYPDLASPTDSVIAGDFGSLSAEEQERQREEWKDELKKTTEEILTLRQVLASKEAHAQGLKRRLGITHWREFSEDMTQGLKNLQESQAFKKTAEVANAARERSYGVFSSLANTASYISVSEKVGSAFGAAKNRMAQSLSSHNVGMGGGGGGGAGKEEEHPADGNTEKPTKN